MTTQTNRPVTIYISAATELMAERESLARVIAQLPVTLPWRILQTPTGAEPLDLAGQLVAEVDKPAASEGNLGSLSVALLALPPAVELLEKVSGTRRDEWTPQLSRGIQHQAVTRTGEQDIETPNRVTQPV